MDWVPAAKERGLVSSLSFLACPKSPSLAFGARLSRQCQTVPLAYSEAARFPVNDARRKLPLPSND